MLLMYSNIFILRSKFLISVKLRKFLKSFTMHDSREMEITIDCLGTWVIFVVGLLINQLANVAEMFTDILKH